MALVDLFLAGESGADAVRFDPHGLAVDAGAADLGRRPDVAGGRAGRRRVRVRLQGLDARDVATRCGWSVWG